MSSSIGVVIPYFQRETGILARALRSIDESSLVISRVSFALSYGSDAFCGDLLHLGGQLKGIAAIYSIRK